MLLIYTLVCWKELLRVAYFYALQVSVVVLLSMHVLSVDSPASDDELCTDERHGIHFVFDCTTRGLQVSEARAGREKTKEMIARIGRRAPLAVLTLISGLSSVSLAITLLGTGHRWLEIIFSLLARGCLRICYCLLILFTAELYPTSVR